MPSRTQTITSYDKAGNLIGTQTITYEVSVEQDNRDTITTQATAALAANRTFLASTPTVLTDLTTQVKALTRQNNKIIRLLLNQLDATD